MPRPLAMLYLIAAMALTGANVPLAKVLASAMPAEILLALRFAIASLLLVVVARGEAGLRLASLEWRQWGAVTVLALVGSVLFTFFLLEGVKRTSGISAGIILASLPAVVALIGLASGDRLRRGDVAMILLAVAGLALIQGREPDDARIAPAPLLGNLLIGVAVFCEAAFVVVARGISRSIAPLRLSLAVALVSLLACLPSGLVAAPAFDAAAVSAGTWVLLVWYALTASVLCTVLWYRGAAHVETWMAGLATAAVPVAAMIVSAVVLHEPVAPAQLGGAVLVVAAIVAGTLPRRRPLPRK